MYEILSFVPNFYPRFFSDAHHSGHWSKHIDPYVVTQIVTELTHIKIRTEPVIGTALVELFHYTEKQ